MSYVISNFLSMFLFIYYRGFFEQQNGKKIEALSVHSR